MTRNTPIPTASSSSKSKSRKGETDDCGLAGVNTGYRLGSLEVSPGLVLSPMSGVTDSAFRRLVKRASGDSVGLLVTEFVSVEGVSRQNLRTMMRMAWKPEEHPICVQIFGGEPEKMAMAAALAVELGADAIDVNCGCPSPRVVRKGGGADLHRDLPRLGKILEAVHGAIGDVPMTMKMRSGWDHKSLNASDMARVAVESGAVGLAVHGRTRVQLYRGIADWDVVAALQEEFEVPVLGSGDVTTPEEAVERIQKTRCAGLMLGRGAIGNPWLLRQIHDEIKGVAIYQPTVRDVLELVDDYYGYLAETLPERALPGRLKQVIARLTKKIPGGERIRKDILQPSRGDELMKAFHRFMLERYELDAELPVR